MTNLEIIARRVIKGLNNAIETEDDQEMLEMYVADREDARYILALAIGKRTEQAKKSIALFDTAARDEYYEAAFYYDFNIERTF